MKTGTNLRRIITIILQIFFAILLIIYLIINTRIDVLRSQLVYNTVSYDDFDALPPPAFSLCSDNNSFNFNCTIYGTTTKNCPEFIKFVNVSDDNNYNGWFTGCNVFHTSSSLLLAKPEIPTKNWTAFQSALFIKYSFFNTSKMHLMIWNSFDLRSSSELSSTTILDPYRLNRFEACREKVFTFRYSRYIFLNGTEKWDMNYRAELGIATKTNTTGVIHFKPESFQVQTTREYQLFPIMSVITIFIILLAVLYTTYYSCLGGSGRYRTTGLAHMITRYYPQQHIKPPSNSNSLKPSVEDILKVYLVDVDKSNFENK